jgi:hypothetical protein
VISKRHMSAIALVGVLALAGAACGSSDTKAAAPVQSTGTTAAASAQMVTVLPSLSGVGTSVKVDAGTAAALTSLGVKLGVSGTATFDATTSTATFPITSGYAEIYADHSHTPGWIQGSIQHDGSGLTLTAGTTVVGLSNFVVDPGNSILYGTVGGKPGVPLLSLDGTAVKVSNDSAGDVVLDGTVAKLTATAASALDAAFNTTAVKAGLPLGVVHLVAKGTPVTYNASTDKVTTVSRLTGVSTSVKLDAGTAAALTSLGVAVAPVGSATFDASTSTVTFPITGGIAAIHSNLGFMPGYIEGSIIHQGSGLSFTKGSTTVTVTDFVVDPGDSILSATVGGKPSIPLLSLDGTAVKVSMQGTDVVLDGTVARLTDTAATALNGAFATTAFKAGLALGTVHLVAATS